MPCRIGLTQLSNMIREVLEGEPELKILDRIAATTRSSWIRRTAPSASTPPIWC